MDKLGRSVNHLKIERQPVEKDKDEPPQVRHGQVEQEIGKLACESAAREEIWKGEKATAQGSAHVKEEIDRIRYQIEEFKRKGDFNKVAELQYGKLAELEKSLKDAQAKEVKKGAGDGRPQLLR